MKKLNKIQKVGISTVAVLGLMTTLMVTGIGNGKVKINELDEFRSSIVCEVPPEGIDSDNYEIYYKESEMGRSIIGDSGGVCVLTGLLDSKSDFIVKFYENEKYVGEQSLDKFEISENNVKAAGKGNLDIHLEMKSHRDYRLYSNDNLDEGLDFTYVVFNQLLDVKEITGNPELINKHCIMIDQIPWKNKVDQNFSIMESRFPEIPKHLYINSDYFNKPKLAKIPQVVDLENGDIALILDLVPDNSIKVNNDVYTLDSVNYTRDNILASRKRGDKKVSFEYKINGKWYNLLDPKYKNSKYFNDENAIDKDTLETWVPKMDRYYQGLFDYIGFTDKIELPLE